MAAPILEEALGQPVVVVNQPGASGATGTQAALDAPRDGYTWTANAVANNATYAITGLVPNTSIDDYRIYLLVANVPVVSVHADAPYQDMGQLLEAMKAGEKPTVATAGVNSSGGMALAALQEAAGGEGRMIAYDGGAPAALAAAGGEAEVDDAARLRAGGAHQGRQAPAARRALRQAAEIEGIDPIPPITQWLPDMHVSADYFGILIPTRRAAGGLRHGRPHLAGADRQFRGIQDLRRAARRGLRSGLRRGGAGEGDAGHHLGGLRARDARRGGGRSRQRDRHRLQDDDGEVSQFADQPAGRSSPGPSAEAMPDRRKAQADVVFGAMLFVLAVALIAGAWNMDRLELRQIHPLSAPGLTPGLLGIALAVASLMLVVKAARALASPAARVEAPAPAADGIDSPNPGRNAARGDIGGRSASSTRSGSSVACRSGWRRACS